VLHPFLYIIMHHTITRKFTGNPLLIKRVILILGITLFREACHRINFNNGVYFQ
jgi:hypothetical protein